MNNKLILFVLLAIFGAAACKKDEPQKSNRDLLIEKTCWKIKTIETKDQTTGTYTDVTHFLFPQACKRDNCYRFYKEGKYEESEGATKCNDSNPDIISSGNWSMASDNKTVTITQEGGSNVYVITSINATNMVVEGMVEISFNTVPVRYTYE